MHVAGRDDPCRDPSRRLLEKGRAGVLEACTSTEALQEILWRYCALRRLDLAASVQDLFVQPCPEVLPVTLADTDRARQLLVSTKGISAGDAIDAAVMLKHSLDSIAAFDVAFEAIDGITRLRLYA